MYAGFFVARVREEWKVCPDTTRRLHRSKTQHANIETKNPSVMTNPKILRTLAGVLLLVTSISARAQFLDSTTGLLQMPTAVMNPEGTFMITNNYVNHHALSPIQWNGKNTFGYGFSVALWDRVEVAYTCTIMYGTSYYIEQPDTPVNWVNQDRHLSGKILLVREGDFGKSWMPAIALGFSDPFSIPSRGVPSASVAYFNRYYVVITKRGDTSWGKVGTHLGYQFSFREDLPINAPCAGVDWKPTWIQTDWLSMDLIAEFDSRTFNLGFIAALWNDHLEAMFDLQALKWVSFGLRFKMHLK